MKRRSFLKTLGVSVGLMAATPNASVGAPVWDAIPVADLDLWSQKTLVSKYEIFRKIRGQRSFDGVRRSRWAIICADKAQVRDEILEWQEFGPEIVPGDGLARIKMDLPDGTKVESSVLFIDASTGPSGVWGLALTGAVVKKEVPILFVEQSALRCIVGRYPGLHQGGPSWTGVYREPDDET